MQLTKDSVDQESFLKRRSELHSSAMEISSDRETALNDSRTGQYIVFIEYYSTQCGDLNFLNFIEGTSMNLHTRRTIGCIRHLRHLKIETFNLSSTFCQEVHWVLFNVCRTALAQHQDRSFASILLDRRPLKLVPPPTECTPFRSSA